MSFFTYSSCPAVQWGREGRGWAGDCPPPCPLCPLLTCLSCWAAVSVSQSVSLYLRLRWMALCDTTTTCPGLCTEQTQTQTVHQHHHHLLYWYVYLQSITTDWVLNNNNITTSPHYKYTAPKLYLLRVRDNIFLKRVELEKEFLKTQLLIVNEEL